MPHAYCTTCRATVTVSDNRCLAGHPIDGPILATARGRHRAPSWWEQLIPGRGSAAGQHRATRISAPVEEARPEPKASAAAKPLPARPAPQRAQEPVRTHQPAVPARPPVQPVTPRPAPAAQWSPSEESTRSVYTSALLEMLGLDETAGFEPTVAATPLIQPEWQNPVRVAVAEKTGLDELPALSDMRMVNESDTDTGTLIERLWFATEEHDAVRPATNLSPTEFSQAPERTFRWTIVVAAGLGLAVVLALILIGMGQPGRIAERATSSYRTAITEARSVLPIASEVMLAITDPAVTTEGLSDAAVTLSRLDTASRNLFTSASEPLAATPPFVSREGLDALTPIRTDMANASQDGLAVERRLGDALTYRLVFERAFVLPDLPIAATPDEISALGVELGLGLAGTLDAIAALPNDPAFEAHRAESERLAGRYAEWQIEYLGALRAGDATTATDLVAELQGAVDRLTTGISRPLETVAAWATEELDRYNTTLARLAGNLD